MTLKTAQALAQAINRTALPTLPGETQEQYLYRLQRTLFAGKNLDEFQQLWFDRFSHQGLELELSGLAFMGAEHTVELEHYHLLFSLPELLDELDDLLADKTTLRALSKHPKLVRMALSDRVDMFTVRCRELGFQGGLHATA